MEYNAVEVFSMKRIISLIFVTITALYSVTFSADAAVKKAGMSFRILKDSTVEIMGYDGSQGKKPVIPDKIGGRKVTSIGEFAFSGNRCKITSIKIPKTVKKIKQCAFSMSKLSSVKIPESVQEIGFRAFDDTKLTSIVIPSSVKKLGKRVFADSKKLKKVVIKNGVSMISEGMFSSCTKLTKIVIPNSVKQIRAEAFQDCAFKKFHIPKGVTSIKSGAFTLLLKKPTLEKFTVDKDNPEYSAEDGILYNKDKTELKVYPANRGGGSNRNSSFEPMPKLTDEQKAARDFTIPLTVHKIADYAFSASNLQKITVTCNLRTISSSAFADCPDLNTVVIQRGVKTIDEEAFLECHALRKVELPDTLEEIGKDAFSSSGLTRINLPVWLKSIDQKAFFGVELSEVNIPEKVEFIGDHAFGYSVGECGTIGDKYENFVIKGKKDSEAEDYAKANGLQFVEIKKVNSFSSETSPYIWIIMISAALVVGGITVFITSKLRKRKN